jgi:hypothetical protein
VVTFILGRRWSLWYVPHRNGYWKETDALLQPFITGSVKSVEGFEPKMDLKMTAGHDWFRIDADKRHGRLSISAVVSDEQNQHVRIIADGILNLNEHTMPFLMGDPNFTQSPFGHGSMTDLPTSHLACT